jgi:hypothetical protein
MRHAELAAELAAELEAASECTAANAICTEAGDSPSRALKQSMSAIPAARLKPHGRP